MPTAVKWRVPLILGVLALSVWLCWPLEEKINLGLDLQGGSHLVMQVDTDSAVRNEVNLAISRIGQLLKERGIPYGGISSPDLGTIEITGTDPARTEDLRRAVEDVVGAWSVSASAGAVRVVLPMEARRAVATTAVDTTLETLRERVDELGVVEPIIQKQGAEGDRIVVQLPGIDDPLRAKKILQEPALLEWKAVNYPPGVADYAGWSPPASREAVIASFGGQLPPDTDLIPERFVSQGGGTTTIWWPLNTVSVVVGNDVRNARRNADQLGRPNISFILTEDAGRRFETATRENVGKRMAIVLGSSREKRVISAPVIRDVIRDTGVIEGNFSIQDAEDLALQLRSGAIPAEVSIIEERTVGPSLGRDSIRSGVAASVAGFVAVMLFMLVYYRFSGVNAVVALLMNVVLVLGAMAYFGATLTLPGIAGLILTVGMAVDSNVLIFERIREELRHGKTVRSSVEQGFSRAFGTIIDTHVTTLVSAFFLFTYGTGPVRGFAVTLVVGLVFSMFTAVFVSRTIYELILGESRRVESLSI